MKYLPKLKLRTWLWIGVYASLLLAISVMGIYTANRVHSYKIPIGAVSLEVPYNKYLVGESIGFTVKNNFNSSIFITNHCPDEPLAVYRQEAGKWTRLHSKSKTKSCDDSASKVEVKPGSSRSANFDDWPDLFSKPGIYRVVVYIGYFNQMPYQDFEIIAKPEIPAPITPTPAVTTSPQKSTAKKSYSSPSYSSTQQTQNQTPTSTNSSKTVSLSSGSVYVTYNSSGIVSTSVTPASGCSYEKSGRTSVEITFKCGGQETQLKLSVRNGQLVQSVEN